MTKRKTRTAVATVKRYLLTVAAWSFLGCGSGEAGAVSSALGVRGAILGQSNAVGLGLEPGRLSMPEVSWREHVGDRGSSESVDRDWGPLSVRPDGGFGVEFGIARMASAGGYRVALEKFAIGSTPLAPDGAGPAWLDVILPEALRYLAGEPLSFVLWWQGEADAWRKDAAIDYGKNLAELAGELRAGLDLPDLVIVAVRLRVDIARPYASEERASLESWRAIDPFRHRVVDVDDLPVDPANLVHYMGPELDEAGRRAWEAFRE